MAQNKKTEETPKDSKTNNNGSKKTTQVLEVLYEVLVALTEAKNNLNVSDLTYEAKDIKTVVNEACKRIAEERKITESTVKDALTRRLGLNTEESIKVITDYVNGTNQKLKKTIQDGIVNVHKAADEKNIEDFFSKMDRTLKGKTISNEVDIEEIKNILQKSKQIILSGPPGTGKTKIAKEIAVKLTGDSSEPNTDSTSEDGSDGNEATQEERIKFIQFHPSYGYEDFVIGIDPKVEKGKISYEVKRKIIAEFADEARENRKKASKNEDEEKYYVLIIDEINRAPLASVLGEILYALEYRGQSIDILHDETLTIPDNLYIIGTMNTADRSIAEIDYALRRRFSFVKVLPQKLTKDSFLEGDNKIFAEAQFDYFNDPTKGLFRKENLASDICGDDVKIGTSFFICRTVGDKFDENHLKYKISYEIIPMIREYYKDGIFRKRAKVHTDYRGKSLEVLLENESEFIESLIQLGTNGL